MSDSGKPTSTRDEGEQISVGDLREQPPVALGKELQGEPSAVRRARKTFLQRKESFYSGPYPPPEMLAEFGQLDPDFPKRILDRADKEQDFRHEATRYEQQTERRALNHAACRTYPGQIFAFLIAMTTISGSLWLMSQGYSWHGLAGVVFALAALTTVFVVGKRAESASESRESDSE